LFLCQPLNRLFDRRPVIFSDVGDIVVGVLEMLVLLQQRRLIDVVVGGDATIMGYLRQLPHIVQIIAADVDVQEN